MFRVLVLFLAVLLLGISGVIVAQDGPPPGPPMGRPPLVECVEGETMPCVEIVDEISDIVGTWRRYYEAGTAMTFMDYGEDGSWRVTNGPHGTTDFEGTTTIEDGITTFQLDIEHPAPAACYEPGTWELRLIRFGEQPVALTYQRIEDNCYPRIGDFAEPMLYFANDDVEIARIVGVPMQLQSLIPCSDDEAAEAYPCDVIATSPEDIAGVWKQYLGFLGPNGMGYLRYNSDGSFSLADSIENSSAPYETFPFGTVSFEDKEMTFTVDSEVPPGCETAVYYIRVIRVGDQPVALVPTPVNDECVRRRDGDMAEALIWAGAE